MTRNTTASPRRSLSPAGALKNFWQRPVGVPPPYSILDSMDAESKMEPEILRHCCRAGWDSSQTDRLLSLLRGNKVDWDGLVALAERHRVAPLLYHRLKSAAADAVPARTLERLERRFHFNLAGNLTLARELTAIVASFRASGIDILPWKGVAAAAGIYGSLALRSAGDLDLLIHRRDLRKAKELLEARGFIASEDDESTRLELHLYRKADRILVDLRWRITPSYFGGSLDLDYLRESIQPLPLIGGEVPSLAAEELLLTLCVHGSKHEWERLMWVCDVAELVRAHPGLDWTRVARHASRLGVSRATLCGLLVARAILDAPVPDAVLASFGPGNSAHLAAVHACRGLFLDRPGRPSLRYHLRLMERRGDQIRYLVLSARSKLRQLCPNDLDRAAFPLPRALEFLYFLVRPIRLLVTRRSATPAAKISPWPSSGSPEQTPPASDIYTPPAAPGKTR